MTQTTTTQRFGSNPLIAVISVITLGMMVSLLLPHQKLSNRSPIAPRFGDGCGKCGDKWEQTIGKHETPYEWTMEGTVSGGLFPLCEMCWSKLGTPEKRMPYYQALVHEWAKDGIKTNECWPKVVGAVNHGL